MPNKMLLTTENIIFLTLNWFDLSAADRWANVLKSSSVKGNVERSGVMSGSVR
jgi:hypothetical protein